MPTAKLDSILAWLLPGYCLACYGPADRHLLCPGCVRHLPWNQVACIRCALPLVSADQSVCRHCARRPPPQHRAMTALRYQAPIPPWIQALKFDRRLEFSRLFADLIWQTQQQQSLASPDVLIPIPLHPRRQRQRGFNQSALIARRLARRLNLSLDTHSLRRIRDTQPQSRSASALERRRNIRGAFSIDSSIAGKHIALLDDVITTGSTVAEAARTCLKAGAKTIEVWAVARTP